MAAIYFVGTYRPIICGIADYTYFLTRERPARDWGVLSFDPTRYDSPCHDNDGMNTSRVWYGVPGRHQFSASVISAELRALDAESDDVVWFQHETAIWPNTQKFVAMLKHLNRPKVVTFHTLHFQSSETPQGLLLDQYQLLSRVLPHLSASTVFSYGVYRAVTRAFPEYANKVMVMKHGVHLYPSFARLSRQQAKEELCDFLLNRADIAPALKKAIDKERILMDPGTIVLGQTGFLCPLKQSEMLYAIRDRLQKMIPSRRRVAMRIGSPREDSHRVYAETLRRQQDGRVKFLVDNFLPLEMLPVAQRAFDINLHWPLD